MNVYDLWFSSVKISNKIKIDILSKFTDVKEIWINSIYENRFIEVYQDNNIGNAKINGMLKSAWNKKTLETLTDNYNNMEIESVNFNHKLYPYRLKNYENSPAVLFYRGNVVKLNENLNVSIVGSRNCSVYGKNVADIISREVSIKGINIISGMARGIDTFAHKGCISSGGYTCAVLGSGIDVVYPKENSELYSTIIKKGCIVSEFLPGVPPKAYNFPMRNRIISALSDVVVVVEAGEKSGALITADMALEQGKSVMAVPGSIFSYESKGTNRLIKEGAYPFTGLRDLFNLLKVEFDIKSSENSIGKKPYEEKIYGAIGYTPVHIDDIFRITNIDIKQLYELLFELQLKNEIVCVSGNYYARLPNKNNII